MIQQMNVQLKLKHDTKLVVYSLPVLRAIPPIRMAGMAISGHKKVAMYDVS